MVTELRGNLNKSLRHFLRIGFLGGQQRNINTRGRIIHTFGEINADKLYYGTLVFVDEEA
jgi:hypothetical protein